MIDKILEKYSINGDLIEIKKFGSGNINKTYVASFMDEGINERYLIQRINTNVFTEPYNLMKNIEGVTNHLKKKNIKNNYKTLDIILTKERKPLCYIDDENGNRSYYRIYKYIENSISYDYSVDAKVVYNTGKAFGNFQLNLLDYPINKIKETIKDFHNTKKRYNKLLDDIKIDSNQRANDVAKEIVFVLKREDVCSQIIDKLGKGIPYRVTHNDTKVNNVLMNKDNGDYLAVIDLDTVMPGSLLFDYGDGIRSTASNAKEDEKDLTKVYLNLELFEKYTDGFLSEVYTFITPDELSLMAESIRIITIELAIRFLDDYINGDTYFKIDYPTHNLDRVKNQIKLVEDIESKLEYMNSYIYKSYNKYKNSSN